MSLTHYYGDLYRYAIRFTEFETNGEVTTVTISRF